MNTETLHALLYETVSDVLESAAYLTVEEDDTTGQPNSSGAGELAPTVRAALFFAGKISGLLTMTVPHTLARIISENMLGQGEGSSESEEAAGDAVGEILNVICGIVLPKLEGSPRGFTMGTPLVSLDCNPDPTDSALACSLQPVSQESSNSSFKKVLTYPVSVEGERAVLELFFSRGDQICS